MRQIVSISPVKITRPSHKNIFLRENLFGILDKCRGKPVIWVCAPPGAGKTTLINSYIESRKLQCLWYQVDSGDNDPATFFHYLGVAALKTNPKKRKPLAHFTPEYLSGLGTFSQEFFSDLYSRLGGKSLIVFDNYQEVPAESRFHEAIYEGLNSIPKWKNVVIISRTPPPPPISRLRLAQTMEIITWDELRLLADEVKGIVSLMGIKGITNEDIRELLAKTEGWIAGLLLMLKSGKPEQHPTVPVSDYNAASLFSYFAKKFFHKMDKDTQDFLLKSSLLPNMTLNMAKELSGNEQTERILSELSHRNYFIQCHLGDVARYQYHPLFREFLLARLGKESAPDGLTEIERKAAGLLENDGQFDRAVSLFHKLADWNSIASLICREAPVTLTQGRHRLLEDWLNRLPREVLEENPWLSFWAGNCHLPFNQDKSRLSFEKAFEVFCKKKEPAGIFLSWCGVIDAIIHKFDDFKPLDRWIKLLDDLLKEYPSFPSKEIKGRVSIYMFFALSFRAPHHPDIRLWVQKAYAFVDEISDPLLFVQSVLYLVDYFIWTGDMEKSNILVERLSKATHHGNLGSAPLISTRLAESLNAWYRGNLQPCLTAVYDGIKISETKGINVYDYFLYGHGAVAALTGGDIEGGEEFLRKAASVLDDKKRFCASYYHHVAACRDFLKKDLAGALEHENLSLELAVKMGSPFAEAMTRTGLALLLFECGERKRAVTEIGYALDLALKTSSRLIEFICYLYKAHFSLYSNDKGPAIENLRKAMEIGKRKGFMNFHMWNPSIMSRLCTLALQENVETEYVKRLIQVRDIFPEHPPLEILNWPWRLKIYVFGKFTVIKDGILLRFGTKVKKPIEMLKILISLGGKNVPVDKISDMLWEDVDGDSAHVVFTTTLKRLRCLLGIEDAVLLRNGLLTLNPRYCWVDVQLFDHFIEQAKEYALKDRKDLSIASLEKAIELYDDAPDIEVNIKPCQIMFHERVKSKFIRSVLKVGAYHEETGEVEKAIECYKKGTEIDIFSEELYHKIMLCLHRQGQISEMSALYRRLTKIFSEALGVEPSSKTKLLYKSLTLRHTKSTS